MQPETEAAGCSLDMDERQPGKYRAFRGSFPFNMSSLKKPRQKKRLEAQKSIELAEDEESPARSTRADNTWGQAQAGSSKKKKRKSLVRKLNLGRFRGPTTTTERHGPEGGDSSRSRSQSSSQESPSRPGEGVEPTEQMKKGAEPQRPLSTVTVVQRKSPSLTIGSDSQRQSLLHCSISTLPEPELTPQADLQRKLSLLEERRAFFQHREIRPILSPDSGSDSSPDTASGETVVSTGYKEERQHREPKRPARHISVRKFDTFSTFEGTFDEDTGLGYLAGIDEDRTESCEDFGMSVADASQDSTTSQSNTASVSANEKREHLYKILVIGELGAGKTSIIKRYVHQFFSQHYRATIGVDFALKVLNWDPQTIIRLQLWDIAGQERFGNMTRVYYKEAVGAFIVFDVTRSATLDAVVKWKQDLDSKVQLSDGSPIPCVLLANKCDQQKEGFVNSPNKMDEYCKEKNFAGWFETSAKENINIEEATKFLVNKILQNDQLMKGSSSQEQLDGERFALSQSPTNSKKSCIC